MKRRLIESVISFCYNFAPDGWQQDEQDFEQWEKNVDDLCSVFFTWGEPYYTNIEVNLIDLTVTTKGTVTEHHQWFIDYLNRLLERARL